MNQESDNLPSARSWRDISQPVKARAMSSGGRWRLAMAVVRMVSLATFVGAVGYGGWRLMAALQENPKAMPAAAKSVPVKTLRLRTTSAGVLDTAWLTRALALPRGISLMELDLIRLRSQLLADGQVQTASLTRAFPDCLEVQITERAPVARVRVQFGGEDRDLVVARDGVVFAGHGYDPAMLDTLPWLGGVALVPDGARFKPIARMTVVSQLLADAQFAAEHLYRSWRIVSLARLDSDDEIEVTMTDNKVIVFNGKGEFFTQLAKLDYMVERLAHVPPARIRIDLSLGRDVPVMIEPIAAAWDAKPASTPLLPAYFSPSSNIKREL